MAHFNVPDAYNFDTESSDDDVEPLSGTTLTHTEDVLCVVCSDKRPNILFLPCRHMKCCEECSSKLAAEEEEPFSCPYCVQIVENTIVAFVWVL